MHQEGACGWQMKRDHWKVMFEVECGGNSNAALPSHLSISKPPGVMKAVGKAHKPAVAHSHTEKSRLNAAHMYVRILCAHTVDRQIELNCF